jgi:hypothetical protein
VADERFDAIRRQRLGVRAALDALELALAAPAAGRPKEWLAAVTERADSLALAFAEHVRVTEARGGVFDDVVAHAPRLANQVTRLRREHVEITAALGRVADAAGAAGDTAGGEGDAAGATGDAVVERAREAALAVMGAIVRHRSAGSSLLYEAYFVDIDAGD